MYMKIYIGADHRGFGLKVDLVSYLQVNNYEVVDMGAKEYIEDDDYSDYGIKVGEVVVSDVGSLGILVCGTGVGASIAANKVKGIRAGLCTTEEIARLAINDDDINVLALNSDLHDDLDIAVKIVDTFLSTPFENSEKRVRRIQKITNYEQNLI